MSLFFPDHPSRETTTSRPDDASFDEASGTFHRPSEVIRTVEKGMFVYRARKLSGSFARAEGPLNEAAAITNRTSLRPESVPVTRAREQVSQARAGLLNAFLLGASLFFADRAATSAASGDAREAIVTIGENDQNFSRDNLANSVWTDLQDGSVSNDLLRRVDPWDKENQRSHFNNEKDEEAMHVFENMSRDYLRIQASIGDDISGFFHRMQTGLANLTEGSTNPVRDEGIKKLTTQDTSTASRADLHVQKPGMSHRTSRHHRGSGQGSH